MQKGSREFLPAQRAFPSSSDSGPWCASSNMLLGRKSSDCYHGIFSSNNGPNWPPVCDRERGEMAWPSITTGVGSNLFRMPNDWEKLYTLQDWVLAQFRAVKHNFYLTGGTALSRGYFQHRYSEDLDFFLNDAADFEVLRDRCLNKLSEAASSKGWKLEIILREERFGRASEQEFREGLNLLVQRIME